MFSLSYSFFQLIVLTLLMALPLHVQGDGRPISNKTSVQAVIFDLGGVVVQADSNEAMRFIALNFNKG